MNQSFVEVIPGTTLKMMVEEHDALREVRQFIAERAQVDIEYVARLKMLRLSVKENWSRMSIWPLVSSIFSTLNKEIEERLAASELLSPLLDQGIDIPSPNQVDQHALAPSTRYEKLKTSYSEYQSNYLEVSSPESISTLQKWYQTWNALTIEEMRKMIPKDVENALYHPQSDLRYRESVRSQRTTAAELRAWYESRFSHLLDNHQTHIEATKSIVSRMLLSTQQLSARLLQSCSTEQDELSRLSSASMIASKHTQADKEILHPSAQPTVYLNFCRDARPSQPLFGVPPIKVVQSILDHDLFSRTTFVLPNPAEAIETIFEMESFATPDATLKGVIGVLILNRNFADCITFSLLSQPPILGIASDTIQRYPRTLPRSKVQALMKHMSSTMRVATTTLILRYKPTDKSLAFLLTHRHDSRRICSGIWTKWDSSNDCPLPARVTRRLFTWGAGLVTKERPKLWIK